MFRRVLIANRGEIAQRIARSCRSLGVEPVMVFSEADRGAPWLDHAARAVCIGPAASAKSYRDATAILQAAEQTDCQAIHPGYGFLAENATFAARCEQQGLTFVGPSPRAILAMGDKTVAKRTMAASGLPTIPGSAGEVASESEAAEAAREVGYPVLLKASAGGGGKGMRRCEDEVELRRGFLEARLESEAAFGNPAMYVEHLIQGGRHIEFQVLCDGFGQALHLGERECSIQRQHQKLLEESPSPAISGAVRQEMGERVARAMVPLGYRGVGTVEFLLAPDGRFFFMEMNTRLQVEHPVTEMVTGMDLVAEQLRVAANRPLAVRQEDIRFTGHAIELRINAEDPARGFRPDPGRIDGFDPPARASREGAEVRWDSAVRDGYRIPPHYDSMIGKLIVHAADRCSAIEAAVEALRSLRIEGVRTTIPLHLRLLDDSAFRRGTYDLEFLPKSGLLSAFGAPS